MAGSELSSFLLKFSLIYPGIFPDRRVQTGGWLGRDQGDTRSGCAGLCLLWGGRRRAPLLWVHGAPQGGALLQQGVPDCWVEGAQEGRLRALRFGGEQGAR